MTCEVVLAGCPMKSGAAKVLHEAGAGTADGLDLGALTDTIARRHPGVPRAVIEVEVAEAASSFADARVFDYIGVLIERSVRERLRTAPRVSR